MAITAVNKSTTDNGAASTTIVTASLTATARRLYLCAVHMKSNTTVSSITGGGLTWAFVAGITLSTTNRIEVWRAQSSAPGAGAAVTITMSGSVRGFAIIDEFAGCKDDSANNGAGCIVQSPTKSAGSGTSLTITLSALANANNASWSAIGHAAAEGTTPEGGYTELGDIFASATGTETQYKVPGETTPTPTWATSSGNLGVAIEVSVPSQVVVIGQPIEADSAQTIAHTRAFHIGQPTEADAAQPIHAAIRQFVTVNQATETDAAQTITPRKLRLVNIGQAIETDNAGMICPVLPWRKIGTLTPVVEGVGSLTPSLVTAGSLGAAGETVGTLAATPESAGSLVPTPDSPGTLDPLPFLPDCD